MKLVFKLLFTLSIFVGNACQANIDARITQRELDIYNTMLADKPKEVVVVSSETVLNVLGVDRSGLKEILQGLRNDTFDDFVKVNTIAPKVEASIQGNFAYRLGSESDFSNDNSEHVRYYIFSRVGFSRDGKQAIVRFSNVCQPLCGRSAYYLLENQNGVWKIAQESVFMQS